MKLRKTWKRTIIDYKKFLEEYADEPLLPPKKKREVDLKQKPSKSRIAAEKYNCSKYFTKPMHLLRPVCKEGERPVLQQLLVLWNCRWKLPTQPPKQKQQQYQLLCKKLKRQSKYC